MTKVLILGSSGFLGSYLFNYLSSQDILVYTQSRKKDTAADFCIDLALMNEITVCLNELKPDVIINLTAETNVDFCEKNKDIAYQANSLNVQNLVNSILETRKDSYLICISTDQVYSGKGPHKEENTKPINIYGKTKLLGEKNALNKKNCVVLRTNFIGSNKKNKSTLSDWIVGSLKQKEKIDVFDNIYFNPVYIETLCQQIHQIIKLRPQGIYNLGSRGSISKASFAFNICRSLDLDEKLLKRKTIEKSKLIAKRPNDMTMHLEKYSKDMNIVLPSIENEIEKLVNFYQKNG